MVRDLVISAVEEQRLPDDPDLSPNPREKNFFSSKLSLVLGRSNNYLTTGRWSGRETGYLWTHAEVLRLPGLTQHLRSALYAKGQEREVIGGKVWKVLLGFHAVASLVSSWIPRYSWEWRPVTTVVLQSLSSYQLCILLNWQVFTLK